MQFYSQGARVAVSVCLVCQALLDRTWSQPLRNTRVTCIFLMISDLRGNEVMNSYAYGAALVQRVYTTPSFQLESPQRIDTHVAIMQREGDLPQYFCANVMLSSFKIVSRGIGQRTVQEQEETALSTMKIEVVAPSGAKSTRNGTNDLSCSFSHSSRCGSRRRQVIPDFIKAVELSHASLSLRDLSPGIIWCRRV